jgi:lipopolysaccharide assembly protein A
MQFLKTLFWVVVAVALVLFASANWDRLATVDLWGGLQADVKLPVLVLGAFLLGFLPTFILYRTRIWSLKRRLDGQAPVHVANAPAVPVRNAPAESERVATDSKVWPIG